MPPHLKKSNNQAQLENGTYEQIVSHLERELELNGLEAPDEMQLNTVMQQDTQQNSEKPKPTCHHCKKPGHYRNQCRQHKREKDKVQNNTDSAANNTNNNGSAQINSNPNPKAPVANKANNTNNQRDRKPRPVFPPCETCGRANHSTERCYLGANAANRPPPRNRRPEGQNQAQQRNTQKNSDGNFQAAAQPLNYSKPRLHSGTARDRPETNEITKLPPIPEVVRQQPTEIITQQDDKNNTKKNSTLKADVASQTSPPKGNQPQKYVDATEQSSENQTRNELVSFLSCSKGSSTDTQNAEQHVVTTPDGDTTT